MRVLVSGGAGYIGSHTVLALIEAGHDVVVVDDFANSKPTVVGRLEALSGHPHPGARVRPHRPRQDRAPLRDRAASTRSSTSPGFKAVGESVEKPLEYYEQQPRLDLLAAARDAAPRRAPAGLLLLRDGVRRPAPRCPTRRTTSRLSATNPYGRTKVMSEHVLARRRPRRRPAADRAAALLQPGRRAPVRHDRRGPAGHPQQPDAVHRPGRGRAPREAARSSATTTPPPTAPASATTSTSRTSPPATSPRWSALDGTDEPVRAWNLGTGHRHQRARAAARLRAGRRARAALRDRRPPRRRPRRPTGPTRPGPTASSAGRPPGRIDDMCADTWRWQSQNPDGYPDA